jgi:hypothetical protein
VENRAAAVYYMMITESPEYRSKYLTYLTNIRMGNTSKTYGLATNVLATRDVIDRLLNDNGDEIAAYRRVYKFTRLENPHIGIRGYIRISNVCVFQDSGLISDTTDITINIEKTFRIIEIKFDSVHSFTSLRITKTGSNPEVGKPAVWTIHNDPVNQLNDRFHIMFTIELIRPFEIDTNDIVHIQHGLDSLYITPP